MNKLNRLIMGIIVLLIIVFVGVNISFTAFTNKQTGRTYQVEINRLQHEIAEKGINGIDLKEYSYIKDIAVLNEEEPAKFFEGNGSDYAIGNIAGTYYRFDYIVDLKNQYQSLRLLLNISMICIMAVIFSVLIYIWMNLIKPFYVIQNLPYELAKGNLTSPLKENSNRYFGKFMWGLDLLRENLEEQKEKELALQKEKKTLVLSISHDIKTPLSALKLYAKALAVNLYDREEKRIQIAESIGEKADEIEDYVSEIVNASKEYVLDLFVDVKEFYLVDMLREIESYYREKLALLKIEFHIKPYHDCLLKGDKNRAVEVLQNIIENAIKYGDGGYIKIAVSKEEECRLISITNSGNALSKSELPYIFDSFWRGSNAGGNKGSGLGLYICRHLLHKMDGEIYAECRSEEMCVTTVLRMV